MFYPKRIIITAAVLLLASCSTTKDRWVNRKYHEVTSHYNAYFNGEEAFNEAVDQFQTGEEWDFEQFLPIYFWPDADQASGLFAKMDRAIEKTEIALSTTKNKRRTLILSNADGLLSFVLSPNSSTLPNCPVQ